MPFAARDGVRLYWKLEGAASRPPLVLLNSIGTDVGMWDRAIAPLAEHFLLLRIDTRGHGASDAPVGDYDLALLAADVLAAMDAADFGRAAVAGVSLGGMVAMELALMAPERVAGLGLICTTATGYAAMWNERIAKVRAEGMDSIADMVLPRFLSPAFVEANPAVAETILRTLRSTPRDGYAGAGAAIRDMAVMERLPGVTARTVVVVGRRDVSTPLQGNGDKLLDAIPDARLAEVDAAHLAPVEAPQAVADALARHLAAQ